MSSPNPPLIGDALLEAVTASMLALHKRLYHCAPTTARCQLMDNELLTCVLSGVYTDVERALIDNEQGDLVRQARRAIQHVMRDAFIAEVQRLSGRGVTAFVSTNHIDPDLEVELFWLAARP